MRAILALIRPHQWLKNGFVLAGILFSHKWDDPALVLAVGIGFASFCLASSAMYVLNDYHDRWLDARHPHKRNRPIASGKVSLVAARWLIALLFASALLLPASAGEWAIFAVVAAYLALNVAYTLRLKHQVLIDVFCIVAGFMLRLACGTYAVGIIPSGWMLLCSFMLTLFLGFAKRRAELSLGPAGALIPDGSARAVLLQYPPQLLDTLVAITASATLLTYGLYTVDEETVALHGTRNLILTLPIVTFGVFRYLYLLYKHGAGEDPGRDLLSDNQIRLAIGAWAAVVLILVGR